VQVNPPESINHAMKQNTLFFKKHFSTLVLCLLVLLFLIQRACLLFFGNTHIYHPNLDETVSGTLACDLVRYSIRAPLFAYQYLDYTGDIMIEAILLAPVYKILGTSLFTLKLFALLSALISLLTWITILKRYQGIWAAALFTALFAFPPPTFARLNLLATPSAHHILNPILAVQLLLLFRVIEKQHHTGSRWLYFVFGLCAGLGSYVFYSHLIFNAFCFLFLLFFSPSAFRARNPSYLITGALIGFFPWILRSFSAPGGGRFIKSLLFGGGAGIDPWNIVLTFCYNLPHSLGFGYPSGEIGFVSICYALIIAVFSFIIMQSSAKEFLYQKATSLRKKLDNVSTGSLTGMFTCLFPVFFLLGVSLSSKQIALFEYWQNIGLFASSPPLDCVKYRYFHILYPFYFAIIATGTLSCFNNIKRRTASKTIMISCCAAIILCGAFKSLQLYSTDTQNRLLYYKGYDFDLMAPIFLLGSFAPDNLSKAENLARSYPDEHKAAIYQSLGTRIAMDLMNAPDKKPRLLQHINTTPAAYLNDYIFGIVRTVHMVSEKTYSPFVPILIECCPSFFYENWGFRYLAFKYYAYLINQKILFEKISPAAQWFYRKFLNKFKQEIKSSQRNEMEKNLFDEINGSPEEYRFAVVNGLGKFIGAEMLSDSLLEPDYPLDSSFGRRLHNTLQPAFYEGVGRGFAETLCRFWCKILPPEEIAHSSYMQMLEIEWQRCQHLLNKMPQELISHITKGFIAELQKRNLHPIIKKYLGDKIDELVKSPKLSP